MHTKPQKTNSTIQDERAQLNALLCLMALVVGTLAFFPKTSAAQSSAMKSAVVRIASTKAGVPAVPGSGFIVKIEANATYIVTASHVVEGDPTPKVEFFTKRNIWMQGRVIAGEMGDERGFALLIVQGSPPIGISGLPIDTNAKLEGGEAVTIIGHPRKEGDWAVIKADITTRDRRLIYFHGEVDQGNSGGPILLKDRVVGMVTGQGPGFGEAVSNLAILDFLSGLGIAPVRDAGAGPSAGGRAGDRGNTHR